jgi:3-hydroxybutyryl-CoA dehydrogenase
MQLQHVVVVGSGTMGQGIAQWFVQSGLSVELTDKDQNQLGKAKHQILDSWEKLERKGKFTSVQVNDFKNSLTIHDQENLNQNADLVVEAIFEDLEAKKTLFESLDKHFSDKTFFASNTSSFSMEEMAASLPPQRQQNFFGLHFLTRLLS